MYDRKCEPFGGECRHAWERHCQNQPHGDICDEQCELCKKETPDELTTIIGGEVMSECEDEL